MARYLGTTGIIHDPYTNNTKNKFENYLGLPAQADLSECLFEMHSFLANFFGMNNLYKVHDAPLTYKYAQI